MMNLTMVQKRLATGVGGIFIFPSSHLLLCVAVDKPGCEEGEDARDPSTRGVILKRCGELLSTS